jgi:flagellar hook assembly protein FlgD
MTGSGGFDDNAYIHCFPNPFNDNMTIEFSGTRSKTTMVVVNATGSLIKLIYEGQPSSGVNTVYWNGTNESGTDVAPGIYYIRVVSDNTAETVKISKLR